MASPSDPMSASMPLVILPQPQDPGTSPNDTSTAVWTVCIDKTYIHRLLLIGDTRWKRASRNTGNQRLTRNCQHPLCLPYLTIPAWHSTSGGLFLCSECNRCPVTIPVCLSTKIHTTSKLACVLLVPASLNIFLLGNSCKK